MYQRIVNLKGDENMDYCGVLYEPTVKCHVVRSNFHMILIPISGLCFFLCSMALFNVTNIKPEITRWSVHTSVKSSWPRYEAADTPKDIRDSLSRQLW